jgi:hypothetical protein
VIAPGSLERFEVVEIHRRELKAAEYNPRVLSDDARRKLKAVIQKHGILAPIIWNARTGNIVGGHQRISALDDLYQTADYTLKVAKVDLDDVQEREANIALNNPHAQGDMDMAKLEAMFREAPAMDILATGFDAGDLFRLFGASPFESRADDELSEVAKKIREARERQAAVKGAVKEREGTHFYLVVIFEDEAHRLRFTDGCGLEDNRYVDGRHLEAIAADWIKRQKASSESPADESTEPDESEPA